MNKNLSKKLHRINNKVTNHTHDIIFGILSGTGLAVIINVLIKIATMIIPALSPYYLIMYAVLFVSVLLFSAFYFSNRLFRIIYLITSSIWLLAYLYVNLIGGII